MPLCPQITNTQITVVQNSDFVVTSVVPAVPDTADGLANTIDQIVLNSGAVVYYQNDAPTDPPNDLKEGDIWFDTNDGNKQYYYTGTAWVSVQDTAIAAAQSAANAAQTTADGKNRIYRQTTQPSTGPFAEGDLWFDTDDGNKIYRYTSGSWSTAVELGNSAISSLSASKLTAGTIDASVITVSNINAGNISTGTLNADRIASASITGTKIAAGTITASNIASNTITATQIAAGTITATEIASSTITTDKLSAGTLTGFTIQTANVNNRIVMGSSNNALSFFYLGSATAHLLATTGGAGARLHYGATANGSTAVYPALDLDSSGIAIEGSGTYQIASTSLGNIIYGGHNSTGAITIPGSTLSTGTFSSSSTDQTTGTYLSETGAMIARRNNQIPIFSHRYNATGTAEVIRLVYNGADAGGITTTSGGVPAFRNASDYRLKQNIEDFNSSSDLIKQIKLRSYEFIKEPGKTEVGFVAHELAEVLPDLVMGEKDAIDADGNPEYQSVLATSLIPYLTGALKDVILRVEALEQGR